MSQLFGLQHRGTGNLKHGFHAVELYNEHQRDPHMPVQFKQEDDGEHQLSGLLRFEKKMR